MPTVEERPSPSNSAGNDAPSAASHRTGSHSFYGRQSFSRSGWCGTCGLRRGADGRCSNCDAWWTSPLIQYGAPLVIASTFLLLMGVSLLRPKTSFLLLGKPAIAVPAARGFSSIPVPSPGTPGGMYQPISVPQSRPTAYAPPPPPPTAIPLGPLQTAAATQEAALWANQQQLNRLALSVDSTMRAANNAPQQIGGTVISGVRPASRAMARAAATDDVL